LAVKPPSLKTGALNRLVVTIGMMRPVASRAPLRRSICGLALGVARAEGEEVVVVEREAVGAELGELLDGVHDIEGLAGRGRRTGRCRCSRRPQAEGELVVAGGRAGHGDPPFSVIDDLLAGTT
jgi:hypothetical protein